MSQRDTEIRCDPYVLPIEGGYPQSLNAGLLLIKNSQINISIGDDMELTLKQFKGAIKEDKQIYKKGG
jgi:hypothetical protein